MSTNLSQIFHSVLSERDLADPSEFLVALYFAEGFPNSPPPFNESRYTRDIAIVERYHSQIFNKAGRAASAEAVRRLLLELTSKADYLTGRSRLTTRPPRAWLAVFRAAFAQGLINRIVFGAAAGSLIVTGDRNASPDHPAGSPEAIAVMLRDIK